MRLFPILVLVASHAMAAGTLEVRDYQQAGDGLLLFDPATNFEWLSLTSTVEPDYSQAAQIDDFTHGSMLEVAALLTHGGLQLEVGNSVEQMDAALFFLDWGLTEEHARNGGGEVSIAKGVHEGGYAYVLVDLKGEPITARADTFTGDNGWASGHWLRREAIAVPEPTSVPEPAGLTLALLALAAIWRKTVTKSR